MRRTLTLVIFAVFSITLGASGGLFYWALTDLPAIRELERYAPAESSKIYSEEGIVIGEFYLEKRTFIPHEQIPQHVKNALIAIEDVRFYKHPGVDLKGILRALWRDLRAGEIVEGGSTITQQLSKMLFLEPEKSVIRKIKEAFLSLQIERRYTKDEILGLYLNQAFFGAGAYGIESASQVYFGKSSREMTIAEAALLSGIPKAPSLYNPFKNPEKAKQRRAMVLSKMRKLGFINNNEEASGNNSPIPSIPNKKAIQAPYFYEYLRQMLELKYKDGLYRNGLKIYSTLNARMQLEAEKAVRDGIKALESRNRPAIEAALLCIDRKTGQIKAMVGGRNFWESQFNRSSQALRQPGSAFKPFVYVVAIEKGFTPETTLIDEPVSYKGANGKMWSPKNYNEGYRGSVTVRKALADSINVVAVKLLNQVGVNSVIERAKTLGIESTLHPYLSLALGASDVTLLELVRAYASLANKGIKLEIIPYTQINNRDGITIETVKQDSETVLGEKVAGTMDSLLKAVVEEGTAQAAKQLGIPVAGKTGTTNEFTDAWFIGYTPDLVIGVWVGRDNHKPIGHKETGAKAALPIWMDFVKRITRTMPPQTPEHQNP